MRMLLGCVSLLVVLAIVGLLAKTPLKQASAVAVTPAAASTAGVDPMPAATPTRDLPHQVQDDLARAMQTPPARVDDSR